jgi:hypothetical protein
VQEAQQVVAAAHDWSSISDANVQTLTSGADPRFVPLPSALSRIIPNSMTLDNRAVWGPLPTAEWSLAVKGQPRAHRPFFTTLGGQIGLAGAASGGELIYGYIAGVPDYDADPDETVLGAGVPEFVRMFESCILWSALAAYRDSKGLPAQTAAAQAAASIADARARDMPIGALTLVKRRLPASWPALATGSGGGIVDADLEHALLDDFAPDEAP